jgi:hypothetical protein
VCGIVEQTHQEGEGMFNNNREDVKKNGLKATEVLCEVGTCKLNINTFITQY